MLLYSYITSADKVLKSNRIQGKSHLILEGQ